MRIVKELILTLDEISGKTIILWVITIIGAIIFKDRSGKITNTLCGLSRLVKQINKNFIMTVPRVQKYRIPFRLSSISKYSDVSCYLSVNYDNCMFLLNQKFKDRTESIYED